MNPSKSKKKSALDHLEPLDLTVLSASRGEAVAIALLAVEHSAMLHRVARKALGPVHEQYADDVVQTFWVGLLERRFAFPLIRGGATAWMKRIVRTLAAELREAT